MLNNYCLILFSAAANLLCAEFICGLFGFYVCTVGFSYLLVLYVMLCFLDHVVLFTVLPCNLMLYLSLSDFLCIWHLSVCL